VTRKQGDKQKVRETKVKKVSRKEDKETREKDRRRNKDNHQISIHGDKGTRDKEKL
jgi:hypothetical protein